MRVLSAGWARPTVAAVVLAGAATTALTVVGASHDVRAVSAIAADFAAPSWLERGFIRPVGTVKSNWVDHGSAYRFVVVASRPVTLIAV